MKTTTALTFLAAFLTLTLCCVTASRADPFGSGLNAFDIDFVTIGDSDNADDTTGAPNPAGKVDYTYRMGQFEISEDMIDKANAETASGPNPLNITHDNRGDDKPATSITWFEAARFVNWLNTDSGSTPAYKFNGSTFELWTSSDAGYDANNLFRNSQARYFLPSMDEWYKAAYYNPTSGAYGDYPTANGLIPTAVSNGTAANTAVFSQSFATGPADITQAGGLSPYGTMGQGGNVWEWEESKFDLVNDSSSFRGVRGGSWGGRSDYLLSLYRSFYGYPTNEGSHVGFRVASIPEPTSLLLGAMASVGLLMRKRRLG